MSAESAKNSNSNAQPDEVLREKAREFRKKCLAEMDERTPDGEWLDIGLMAAFAQSILAEVEGHCAHCVCECPECRK